MSQGRSKALDVLTVLARDADASALNHRHLQVLSAICRATRGPPTAADIAETLTLDRLPAWRALNLLAERGFITRLRIDDAPDRRKVYYAPTDTGRALEQRVTAALAKSAA